MIATARLTRLLIPRSLPVPRKKESSMRKSAWSVLVLPLLALPGAVTAQNTVSASYITGKTFDVNGGEVRYP